MKKNILTFILLAAFPVISFSQQNILTPVNGFDLTEAVKEEVVDKISTLLVDNYVFPETAEKMSAFIKSRMNENKYKSVNDVKLFSEMLTSDLQSVSNDKHIRVAFNPEVVRRIKESANDEDQMQKLFAEDMRKNNFGFKKVEILEGNIGYIDLRGFNPVNLSRDVILASMKFLENTDAIIFDLRYNGGGDPETVQLISSFLFSENPVHLNSLYFRPENITTEFWTLKDIDGRRRPDTDVYVLTSSNTFSAAEEFTYNLKNLKRAVIIGETTGGGANPGEYMIINDNFGMFVPTGRAINPVTKTNWEGTGVTPDISVESSKALLTAHIEALKKLKEKNPDSSRQLDFAIMKLNFQINPYSIDESSLAQFAGDYGNRKILVENGKLYYQREGRPKAAMISAAEDMFTLSGIDYFIIKIERDPEGNVTAINGIYDNGQIDRSEKIN